LRGNRAEGFGHNFYDLIAANEADVVVGKKRDGAATLRAAVDQDDGAGGGYRDFAGGENGCGTIDFRG
jgi:hypothetical protein